MWLVNPADGIQKIKIEMQKETKFGCILYKKRI